MFVKVIIDNPSSQTDIEFEYYTNEEVKVGMRLLVPFGLGDIPTLGIALKVSEKQEYKGPLKNVIKVLDDEAIVTHYQLDLLERIKKQAICPKSRILNMMIPQALRLKKEKYLRIIDSAKIDANLLALFEGNMTVKYTDKFKDYKPIIDKLIKDGAIKRELNAIEKRTEKYQSYYELIDESYYSISPKRMMVIDALRYGKQSETDLLNQLGITKYVLDVLTKEKIIRKLRIPVSRIKERYLNVSEAEFEKSIDYNVFLNKNKKIVLLNNTDSEFELIYQLIKEFENGKVLIVVPEILKGYVISSLINKYFEKRMVFLHKGLNENIICEQYLKIKNNEYDIVIASVAFILWDYSNFDTVIVIDEDSSIYKLDQSPRIDCIKTIDEISSINNQRLILTTYAMSLARCVEVIKNHYELIDFNRETKTNILVYDSLKALKDLDSNVIVKDLSLKIKELVIKHEKIAFVLNNKSYAKGIYCLDCNKKLMCPNCGSALFYQKEKNLFKCPTCFFKKDANACPNCGSHNLTYIGVGQEQLMEYLDNLNYRTFNLNTNSEQDLDEIADLIALDKIDCLVCSFNQFKSVDGSQFSLVVLVDFDALTNAPNYNAHLEAFNVLNTIKAKNIKEMAIQTYNPMQPTLVHFIEGSVDEFYDEELKLRQNLKLKPFYNVDQILIKADYSEMLKIANTIKKTIKSLSPNSYVLGPSYNYKEKKAQLIVKTKDENINNIYLRIYDLYQKTNVVIIIDRNSDNFG